MTRHGVPMPIVAGVDGSASAQHAVRWAAREVSLRRVPLRLLHSYRVPRSLRADPAGQAGLAARARAHAAELLAATRISLARTCPDVAVETELERLDPRTALIAESKTAPLVVVGARGSGGLAGLCLGSVGAALAEQAECPVVIVRGSRIGVAPPLEGTVVAGVDGSEASEAVLEFAFEAAAEHGADLVAVHAWSDFLLDSAGGARSGDQYQELVADADDLLMNWLAPWEQKYPGVPIRRHAVYDRPHRALQERSRFAQLVVVGSRGRGAVAATLLGSTSRTLLHHAHCPVAVVPSH